MKKLISVLLIFFYKFIFFHNLSFPQNLNSNLVLQSPMYYLMNDFKIISDSINLNGYLVFEIITNDNKIRVEDSNIYNNNIFLTTKCYFVYEINDIYNHNSIKFYYNSNRIVLDFFKFYEPKNIMETEYFLKFNLAYDKVEKKIENGEKIFRIEDLKLENFKNINTYKINNEKFNSIYLLIFKININSFLFSNTIKDDMYLFSNEGMNLTLGFFEPIGDSNLFVGVEGLESVNNYFIKSKKFFDLFEFK